jgi:hypothetical protein
MTSELKARLAALRGISPRLNAVTDQVSEIVKSVETTLVEDLSIGTEAKVLFHSEPGAEAGTSLQCYLAFGRVGSAGYRLHVLTFVVRETMDEKGAVTTSETLKAEQTLWPSCSRELKLRAFERLPDLLDAIVQNAEGLLQTADQTAARVREMVGESDFIAPTREAYNKKSRSGRRRRREYSIQDAIRAHRQYFFDQGISEAAMSSLTVNGWEEDGPDSFVNRDGWGKVRCSVVFEDEDGTAEVGFPDGESDSVTVEDEG